MEKFFKYDDKILDDFPSLTAGIALASELNSGSTPEEFSDIYLAEQRRLILEYSERPLSQIPSINAWRRAFRAFGVNPTKYRSAVEALLRRLTKKGDIPQINLLVDIANLVSIRYALPVAVFDIREMSLPLKVHYAEGAEIFTPLGSSAHENPLPGEVVFSDEKKIVAARRWCWRQSAGSAASQRTMSAIITMEAQHEGGGSDVANALEDLSLFTKKYATGQITSSILSASSPD